MSHVEQAVRTRYAAAAQACEAQLCCPIDYDPRYLEAIPAEILERDYGCGDPSRFVRSGDTVLDLGSGGGKICYIASQIAGPQGRVIGIDWNDAMLQLARRHLKTVAERIGYANVEFYKGKIQDLQLDYDRVEAYLRTNPIRSANEALEFESLCDQWRREPLIPDAFADLILSNCVLNLVKESDRRMLFREMHRVLKVGGRVAISDIVADEDVPQTLRDDPTLWSGCISGAFREDRFLQAFEEAGFYGVELVKRDERPWQVVEGIEFRSVTVQAWKGAMDACLDRGHAAIYRGPWKQVMDEDGFVLKRGARIAVCERNYLRYTSAPYSEQIVGLVPTEEVPAGKAQPMDCGNTVLRPAGFYKAQGVRQSTPSEGCCSPGQNCER